MYALDPELVARYELPLLHQLDHFVADLVGISVPFNNYITGYSAFMHKAGIHAKAVLNNPATYEILRPEDFGLNRYIHVAHRLTGWNAMKDRAQQLGISLSNDEIKELTATVKRLSDLRSLTLTDVDNLLHSWPKQIRFGIDRPVIGRTSGETTCRRIILSLKTGKTLTEKIFSMKLGRPVCAGEMVIVKPDVAMGHDSLTPGIIKIMREQLGIENVCRSVTDRPRYGSRCSRFDSRECKCAGKDSSVCQGTGHSSF